MQYLFSTFKDKKVLVTGHTGFKGSWLAQWLGLLSAKVYGVSLDPPTEPSNYQASDIKSFIDEDLRIDIRDKKEVFKIIKKIKPDYIFHLAAQAIVGNAYKNPLETFETNVLGSANILNAINDLSIPVIAIMITSDKVYENVEWTWGYRENDKIGGKDPYSASKGMAELVNRSYIKSFFSGSSCQTKVAIARAGNVIGGGDWATGRIVPDCIKAAVNDEKAIVRNILSTRPWQHVFEPLSGYLLLAHSLSKDESINGEAFNFGPMSNHDFSVGQLISEMKKNWSIIKWEEQENSGFLEAGLLRLNCDKAQNLLGWSPTLSFHKTVSMTIDWYRNYYNKTMLPKNFSLDQIKEYMKINEELKKND